MDDESGGLYVKQKKSKDPIEAGKPKFTIKPLPVPRGDVTPTIAATASIGITGGEADILGLTSSPGIAAPATKSNSDFDAFFDSSPPMSTPAITNGAATMNDDDFESFLSNLTTPSK